MQVAIRRRAVDDAGLLTELWSGIVYSLPPEDVLFCTTVGLPVVSLLNYLIHCGLGFSDDFVLMC